MFMANGTVIPSNVSSSKNKKNELGQYNVALVITRSIKNSSRKKFYQELGTGYLYQRRWRDD